MEYKKDLLNNCVLNECTNDIEFGINSLKLENYSIFRLKKNNKKE